MVHGICMWGSLGHAFLIIEDAEEEIVSKGS
jgi:hypothetical protein